MSPELTENLLKAGELMLFGMGGVFFVLFLLYLLSILLLKLFPGQK